MVHYADGPREAWTGVIQPMSVTTESEIVVPIDRSATGGTLRRLVLVVASIVVAVALCDAALWLAGPVPQPYVDPVLNRHLNLHPPGVVEFESDGKVMPGISGRTRFTINAFGFRSPRLQSVEKPANTRRIFCVGGSTTECLYVDDDDAWPEQLGFRLQRAAPTGTDIDVVNTGHAGDSTREHITMLAQRVIPLLPDQVIVMAGINDLVLQTAPDYSPVREDQRGRHHLDLDGMLPKIKYLACSVSQIARRLSLIRRGAGYRNAAGNFVQDLEGRWLCDVRAATARLPLERLVRDDRLPRPEYAQNLRSLVGICRSNRTPIVFVTQPSMYRADLNERERSLLWFVPGKKHYPPQDMAYLIDRYNECMRQVAEELDVVLIDLAAELPRDMSVFYDDCHFNVAGCAAVARVLADKLIALPPAIAEYRAGTAASPVGSSPSTDPRRGP